MLSDQDIFKRYQAKQTEFSKQADITLIGHSLFDMWSDILDDDLQLAGQSVANLGISGVSARQYLDVIIQPNLISHLGQAVFLFLGVNDIVKEPDYSPKQVVAWLDEILAGCRKIAPHSHYFLLEATPVNNIDTVTNAQINTLNQYLRSHCPVGVQFVDTQDSFLDNNGELDLALCVDGLHFSPLGYQRLTAILEKQLTNLQK
ncbi:SGNH/GDSL hydrolase family protein [Conservatibacter flavescens]|uniref:Acylneuraminate cytidylyltransferase n=1 Tax=Conservatibacter flavescens TaxID=28161 RepID=A0A2M8S0B2_9PAST|nr:SGNH/GDSL hydrolase family protein [Conservatibacter flavescens]PJG84592.1 acylneuraminate cytidylyltransferase [Conservatibacter flavescens]